MNQITFKLPNDAMREVIELNEKRCLHLGTMGKPAGGQITTRVFDEAAKELGKALLTKNEGVSYLVRSGFLLGEDKEMSQDRFTFFVNPSDTPFLLDLLNQKAMLEKSRDEQPDPGRKGMVMWQIEKLCCRIGNVLVLKNQGVLIDRASVSDKEQK